MKKRFKNKKLISLILIFTLISSYTCFAKNDLAEYSISGQLPDSLNNTLMLLSKFYPDNETESQVADSAFVSNGKFSFKGNVNPADKSVYSLRSNEYSNISGMLILEPVHIDISLDTDTIIGGEIMLYATGTPLNNQLTDSILKPSSEITKQMSLLLKTNPLELTSEQTKLFERNKTLAHTMYSNLVSFIKNNNNNAAGEYIFLLLGNAIKENDIAEILPLLPVEIQQKYKESKAPINKEHANLVGQKYLPFTCKTRSDNIFNLSDIIGQRKLILLDFWASWCVPCIREMPLLIELYNEYKDKGLEIIGISTDRDETQWRKAIEKHGMKWLQVIDGKEEKSNAAEMYGVRYIPYTVLIDSNGIILDTNLRGEKLRERIEDLLQ